MKIYTYKTIQDYLLTPLVDALTILDKDRNAYALLTDNEYNIKYVTAEKNIFYYLGKPYTIIYNKDVKKYYIEEDCIIVKDEKMLNKFYAEECVRIFTEEIEKYKPMFNYLPKFSLRVRKMKTRWGVCNRGNNTVTLNSELLKKEVS